MPAHIRRFLRQTKSKLWFCPNGSLAPNISEAMTLGNVNQALAVCSRFNLVGMEVVLKFERDDLDLVLPIRDSCLSFENHSNWNGVSG
jgi:hypothetical protein